jgi:hypothetical protein
MLIEDHIHAAAQDFLWKFTDIPYDTTDLHPHQPDTRRTIYQRCIRHGYERGRFDPSVGTSLSARLGGFKMGLGETHARAIVSHGQYLSNTIPAHYREHQILLTFWSLSTDLRVASCATLPLPDTRSSNKGHCYLCNAPPFNDTPKGTADRITHIYGSCEATKLARRDFLVCLGLIRDFNLPDSLLAFYPDPTKGRVAEAIVTFNLAVWQGRTQLFRQRLQPTPIQQVVTWIVSRAVLLWNARRAKSAKDRIDPRQRRLQFAIEQR